MTENYQISPQEQETFETLLIGVDPIIARIARAHWRTAFWLFAHAKKCKYPVNAAEWNRSGAIMQRVAIEMLSQD